MPHAEARRFFANRARYTLFGRVLKDGRLRSRLFTYGNATYVLCI